MPGHKGRRGPTLSLIGRDPDAAFYAAEAKRRGGPVLVLGSADGRIAFELAETGVNVVGAEPSELMMGAAESRRAGMPPELSDRVRFIATDLRALRLTERFPLVLAPQNALGLMTSLEDVDAFFATVHHHLDPGGAFVFDVANTPGERGLGPPASEQSDDVELPQGPVEPVRPVFAPHLRERRRENGKGQASIRRLRLRQYDSEELDEALREGGFLALERHGGFAGSPFDEQSLLQVVLAVLDTRPGVQVPREED